MAASRNNFGPSFDFLSGGSPQRQEQPFRQTLRQSTAIKPGTCAYHERLCTIGLTLVDINNESLRAQLNTLQYELDSLKQERELERLEHQSEIRDIQNRAEADFKRAQVCGLPTGYAKVTSTEESGPRRPKAVAMLQRGNTMPFPASSKKRPTAPRTREQPWNARFVLCKNKTTA